MIPMENSSMEEPRGRGVSLWLMPEGGARDRLAERIEGLALRLGTTPFAPHVTLLPGLPGPEAEMLARARALARELRSLRVGFSGVDGLDPHFRCLFFRVAASPALQATHARAARHFGREPEASFDPHLSLVYGSLGPGAKAALKRELSAEAPPPFEARHLHVWRTDGPVGEWRELARVEWGSSPVV